MQRAQTGRGKFISNSNDHLGLKPTFSIVSIATRRYEKKTGLAHNNWALGMLDLVRQKMIMLNTYLNKLTFILYDLISTLTSCFSLSVLEKEENYGLPCQANN